MSSLSRRKNLPWLASICPAQSESVLGSGPNNHVSRSRTVSGHGGREMERWILLYIDPVPSQVTWTGGKRSAKLGVLWGLRSFLNLSLLSICFFIFFSLLFILPCFSLFLVSSSTFLYIWFISLFFFSCVGDISPNTTKILNAEGKSLWTEVLSQYFPGCYNLYLSQELNIH